jgi:hypothetical protein
MRLTVGPLPPAVYWRRRAVVLGAGLLFLIVLLYSCTGSGATPKQGASATPTVAPESTAVFTPETGAPPADEPPGQPATTTAAAGPPVAPPPPGGACTDTEMAVTPVPAQSSVRRGATVELRLKIKNVSSRTCGRDVGADLQELYIKLGAQKIWSSDTCGTAKGSEVVSFPPAHEQESNVAWNGRDASKCAAGLANGPYPNAGEYQVFGRLGTKLSDPVKLTITN